LNQQQTKIDTQTKYIAIFNPEQIKYYINDEKLPIHRISINKDTNKAYILFYKNDATFGAYMNWLDKCKQYKIQQSQ